MSAEQSSGRLDPTAGALALRFQLQYDDVDAFVRSYAVNLSPGGMFIAAQKPPAVGTVLRFEVVLADARPVLRGEGQVVWTAGADPGHEPALTGALAVDLAGESAEPLSGLGVRFGRLDAASRAVLAQVLAHKAAHPEQFFTQVPDPYAAPLARPAYRQPPALLPEPLPSVAPELPPAPPPAALSIDELLPPVQGLPPVHELPLLHGLPPTSQWTPTGPGPVPVAPQVEAEEEAALQALLHPAMTTQLPAVSDAARLLEELLDRRPG